MEIPFGSPCAAAGNLLSRNRKKANRSLEDGWLFFFVPVDAKTVSVLKEAG